MDIGTIYLILSAFVPWICTEALKRLARLFDKKLPDPAIVNALAAAAVAAGLEHLTEGPWAITAFVVYAVMGIVCASFTHNLGHVARLARTDV